MNPVWRYVHTAEGYAALLAGVTVGVGSVLYPHAAPVLALGVVLIRRLVDALTARIEAHAADSNRWKYRFSGEMRAAATRASLGKALTPNEWFEIDIEAGEGMEWPRPRRVWPSVLFDAALIAGAVILAQLPHH